MVSTLDRKLFREMWHMRGQVAAIVLVVAAGVAALVTSMSAYDSMLESQRAYYARYNFAEVFAHVKRAPLTLVQRVEDIEGVARAQPRIMVEVNLDIPGVPEPAVGRLLSAPDPELSDLNQIYIRNGRAIERDRRDEVMVSEAFATARGFKPGDQIAAIINGRRRELTIVGIALSPEYVYAIRSGDAWPDDARFGVLWMNHDALEAAYDMKGAFNDLTVSLSHDASERKVIDRLDALLEPYGSLGAYGRHDQISNRYLSDEIAGLRVQGTIMPLIFLGVAAFLLNVVISRLIGTQREVIATLKAFGFTNFSIGLHYIKMVVAIVVTGALVGIAGGVWAGSSLTELYTQFFHFPSLTYVLSPSLCIGAVLVAVLAAVAGTLNSVRKAIALPPAEAMRPEPPPTFRKSILERAGVHRMLSAPWRMIVRNMERRPVKALMSILGIAMSMAIMIMGGFTEDAMNVMIDLQFDLAQREDATVAFVEPMPPDAVHAMAAIEGVEVVEPFRALAVRLRNEHHTERTAIMGLDPDARVHRIVDDTPAVYTLPSDGLVLSDKLARLLHVGLGDTVQVEVMVENRPVRQVRVVGIVKEYIGVGCYMARPAANRLMQEGETVSGVFLSIDRARRDEVYQQLKDTPGVASVTLQQAAIESFEETIEMSLAIMRTIQIMFACIIAFGVIYNTARISLAERARELATLRVLGFRRWEVSQILLGELAILTMLAIPLGCAIGYGLAWAVCHFYDTELYRIPLVITPRTYAFAATITIIAAAVSGLIVRRRLDRLDLISVLKTRE